MREPNRSAKAYGDHRQNQERKSGALSSLSSGNFVQDSTGDSPNADHRKRAEGTNEAWFIGASDRGSASDPNSNRERGSDSAIHANESYTATESATDEGSASTSNSSSTNDKAAANGPDRRLKSTRLKSTRPHPTPY
jgi:hypothetical protein